MKTILLFIVFLFISCKTEQKNNQKVGKNKQERCFEKIEKINLINEILRTNNIQTYLHLDIEERNPIKIVKNNFLIGLDSFLMENQSYIKIVDSLPFSNLNLRLKITSKDSCRFTKGNYTFYSPIENAEVNGTIHLKDSIWVVTVDQDIEF